MVQASPLIHLRDQLDELRSKIIRKRPTFHVFKYRERRLLYDLNAGVLVDVSEPAFAILVGLENAQPSGEIESSLTSLLASDGVDALLKELLELVDAGFFAMEVPSTDEEQGAALQALGAHYPRSGQVLVQTSCNLKCTYCYEVKAGFHGTGKSMSSEIGRMAVDQVLARSGNRKDLDINFFGGEPLLNFTRIKELVKYATEQASALGKSITFKITTNGVLLTDEVITFLVKHGFGVMISIDGDPEANDVHRRDHAGRGVGKAVIENAKRLVRAQQEAGVRPACIRATLTPQNPSAVRAAEFFEREGFPRVMIGSSNGRAEHKDTWDFTEDSRAELTVELDRRLDRHVASLDGKDSPLPSSLMFNEGMKRISQALNKPGHEPGIGCGVGRNMTAVTEHGDIYPCHRYAGESAYQIGTLKDGINKERLSGYYKEILDVYESHCSGCWARYLCGGQCPWYISRADGVVGTPDKESCDQIRSGSERMLWLYSHMIERESAKNQAAIQGESDVERTSR